MKPVKKNSKQNLPLLKRSSTPCITQRKNSISKTKSSKGKKIHTDPLPSPNTSFTEELLKQLKKSLNNPKTLSRNSSPILKIKLASYLKVEKILWDLIQQVSIPQDFNNTREAYLNLIRTSKPIEIEDSFKDLKTRKWVRKAMIVQLCGVMISSELYNTEDPRSNLKNLMLFIHQNYIELLHLMHTKLKFPATHQLTKLKETISTRRMSTKTEKSISLNQNTEILSGLLKEVCKHLRQNSKQSALSCSIFSILKTVSKLKFTTVLDAISQAFALCEPFESRPAEPFLPPSPSGTFTLVLDLDETLVHFVQSEEEGTVYIRPGCEEFLKGASEWYEIVVFTAGLQDVILY